ncbi:MAG TPA: R3H domain-containing nucleic acid-binding protein [Microthrixaceae bacterium]|nr:R3H domain-containing nucleic acid-binding protein [Microthrixaceae bacterium]
MEWVETTSNTVEEAKDLLLDRLGVDEEEAEFEILEEPTTGLFGRKRGSARVRARIQPKAPRAKEERRRRGGNGNNKKSSRPPKSGGDAKPDAKPASKPESAESAAEPKADSEPRERDSAPAARRDARPPREDLPPADPEVIAGAVKEFLDGLVTAFALDGTAAASVVEGEVRATIDGTDLGYLIGPSGGVVDAVQELARTYSQKESKGTQAPRVKVDVGSYRANRKTELEAFTRTVAERVKETGEAASFEPMGSVDRKTVHDTAAEIDGLSTISEGEDPRRKVVILPA